MMFLATTSAASSCKGLLGADTVARRAVVWLIDCRWRGLQQAEGGPGFGAVVVEAGVETLKAFHVVESQYCSSQ